MPRRPWTALDDLSVCVNLTRLDLSHNRLRHLHGIEDCAHLTWLNVAHNELTNLDELAKLFKLHGTDLAKAASHSGHLLTVRVACAGRLPPLRVAGTPVVNAGYNQLIRFDGLRKATQLRALVLNNNRLVRLDGLTKLVELNSLGAHRGILRGWKAPAAS